VDREGELRRAGWRLVGATSRTHWGWIALALVSALFWTATKVTIPLLAAAAIDKGIIGNDTSELVKYVALMLVVGSFQVIVSGLRRYGAFRLAFRVEADLRHRLFAHLQRLHFAFHDEAQTGQLMARANTDIQMVREFLMLAPLTAASLMILVAVTVVMLTQSVTLALLALERCRSSTSPQCGSRRRWDRSASNCSKSSPSCRVWSRSRSRGSGS